MLLINLIPVVTFMVRYWQGYRFERIELIGAGMVIVALGGKTQNQALLRALAQVLCFVGVLRGDIILLVTTPGSAEG